MTNEERDEIELQKFAEEAAWARFKQEVRILICYEFPQKQLLMHIKTMYKKSKVR